MPAQSASLPTCQPLWSLRPGDQLIARFITLYQLFKTTPISHVEMAREGTRSATGNSKPRVFETVDTAPAIKRTTKPKTVKKPVAESTAPAAKPAGVKKTPAKKNGVAAKVKAAVSKAAGKAKGEAKTDEVKAKKATASKPKTAAK
ncbi:hypothetical protein PGQ11_010396 [Apiospora arundinis]|uniref:Histone H1 n=1 Tax=Apiospora arundinis TaxID=335852 RepID=A0ABR2IAM4_9PEZI